MKPVTEPDVRRALDEHGAMLYKFPSVQGTGVGEQISGGVPTGRLAVKVYVDKKLPLDKMDPKNVLPKSLKIDGSTGDSREIPVDVVETGKLSFERNH